MAATGSGPVVTFDLFSALLDSRRGGAVAFERIGRSRGWGVGGADVYDHWDRLNKAAQQRVGKRGPIGWVSFRDLAKHALDRTYAALEIEGDPRRDADALIAAMADWPLWPDVREQLPALAAECRVGLLSNVDDDIFASTRAAALVDEAVAMTSERLRAYKPGGRIYTDARRRLGPMVHVASSARDVRGALEAGLPVIRLCRPGHELDPDGPRPTYDADSIAELIPLIAASCAAARS